MSKRLTRREIVQKDEFVSGVEKATAWVEEHWKVIAATAGALAAVGLLAGSISVFLGWRGAAADGLLGDAMTLMRAPVVLAGVPAPAGGRSFATETERDEAALEALDRVVEDHPYSRAATVAAYIRGTTLLRLARYDEARTALTDFGDQNADSPLMPLARRALARCAMLEGKVDEAEQILTDLAAESSSLVPTDVALMELARVQEAAGEEAAASETYRRLINEHPQSLYAAEASQALARLSPEPKA